VLSTKIKTISIQTRNSIYYTELCVVDRYCLNFYRHVFFWKIPPLQNSKCVSYLSSARYESTSFIHTHSFLFPVLWQGLIQCSVTSFWADSHNIWFKHTISETKPIPVIRVEVCCNTPDEEEDTQFLKNWYAWTTWNGCWLGVLPNAFTVKASHVTVVLVCIQTILGFICIAHLF